MQTVVNGLKQQYQNQVKFGDIDFDDHKNANLVGQFKVAGHPTFVLVDGKGQQVKKWVGVTPANVLADSLQEITK